jgi:hypothetical protein
MGRFYQVLQSMRDWLTWFASQLAAFFVKIGRAFFFSLPRVALLISVLLIARLSLIVLEAPISLVCSHSHGEIYCHWLTTAMPDWSEHFGTWVQTTVLCSLAAAKFCAGGLVTDETQSAFQALFGFALALNLIAAVWRKCRIAFKKLPAALEKLVHDISELRPAEGALARVQVESRRQLWVPAYRFSVAVTVGTIHLSFMFTAAVAGLVLIIPFVTDIAFETLPFGTPQVILFALCPFFAIGLLHADRIIVQSVIVRAIAPVLYWRRYWGTIHAEALELQATSQKPQGLRSRVRFQIAKRLNRPKNPPAG